MRRTLGRFIFQVYPDRTIEELISRLAEIEALANVRMRIDDASDLCAEQDAIEDALDDFLRSHPHYTRH